MGTFLPPPISDGMSSKGGSIVRNTDYQSAAIFVDLVNPIRDGDSDGQRQWAPKTRGLSHQAQGLTLNWFQPMANA
jgi:hypothetical protein